MKKILNNNLLLLLVIIFVSFGHLLFSIRTDNYFSVDDFAVLAYFKNHQIADIFPEFLIKGDIFGFRKVTGYLIIGSAFKIFGANQNVFNFLLFLLHTSNLIVLYFICLKLTKNKFGSFFVSLIFNKYYLFYYSNLHEYAVILFSLLTILIFLVNAKKWFYLYYFTFIMALLSKETAFSLPFVLLALSWIVKTDRKKIYPMIFMSLLFICYQLNAALFAGVINVNNSYKMSFDFKEILSNFFSLLDYKLVIMFLALPLIFKKYKNLPLLFFSLVTIIPASLLVNRNESYYVYLPMAYLLIYLSLFLPKLSLKSLVFYLLVFYIFGGRLVLPKIARQNFSNWQKVSMENVLKRVEEKTTSGKEIYIGDIHLERDASLMLESGTTDLFLDGDLGNMYNFIYDPNSSIIKVEPKK